MAKQETVKEKEVGRDKVFSVKHHLPMYFLTLKQKVLEKKEASSASFIYFNLPMFTTKEKGSLFLFIIIINLISPS